MGNDEQALTVRNAGSLVPAEDPQKAQERRLKEAEEHDVKLRHIMDTVPIKIKHLQGSSAGAGSGEFHIYRKARTIEQKRMEEIERQWKEEQTKLLAKRQIDDAQQALDTRTAKNRAKRQKRKHKKHAKSGDGLQQADVDTAPKAKEDDKQTDTPAAGIEHPDVD